MGYNGVHELQGLEGLLELEHVLGDVGDDHVGAVFLGAEQVPGELGLLVRDDPVCAVLVVVEQLF